MAAPGDGLTLAHVTKRFGATRALVDAHLQIRPGEVHTLLGENGSGKSTLVKIIGGVHRPDEGEFTLDGGPVARRGRREWASSGSRSCSRKC